MPRNLGKTKRELPSDAALDAVKSSDAPFSLFAKICLYAGLRRGEVAALRYDDIDRKHGVIHVTKAVEYMVNAPHIKEPKTEAGKREAVLLDVLADSIPQKKHGYLFTMEDGSLMTKSSFRKRWAAYYKAMRPSLRQGIFTPISAHHEGLSREKN